ncbi:Soluble NSF attachment protein [Leishmania braziliensis]|nr:Soluble NSF attachment protein [Leishmania braziliensis]
MPFSSVPSSAPQLAPPPPPQPPQPPQQPLQSVLAIGRQQGWGAAAASARGAAMPTGVPSCRMGTRSSVTLMCPEADGAEWPISAPQFSNGCFNKRCDGAVGESFAACAAMAVPKGASEMDHNSYDAMQQQQQQRLLCGLKNESAPAGNADAALAAPQNTNGVCEAIVTAARCGGVVAPSASAPAPGDATAPFIATTAASANAMMKAHGRGSWSCPFGSSASDEALQQQCHDTRQASVSKSVTSPTDVSGVVMAVSSSANAMALVPMNEVASPTGAEMQCLLADAHRAYTAAEAQLLKDGLALREDWMGTRDLFFAAGGLFAAVGEPAIAARCLLHATFINRAFHSDDEALATLAMSVEQLKQSHPRIAVDALLRLAPCYVREDLRYQAARCYRDAAEILENVLDEKEAAVVQYRAALDMYAETQVAASEMARHWERQKRRLDGTPRQHPHSLDICTTNGDVANAAAPEGVEATLLGSKQQQQLVLPKSTALEPSSDVVSLTSSVDGRGCNSVGFPAHGPPQYRVSTTVQRSLTDACRWRLVVLLTRLGRYEEVREAALACAASVPLTLPKTKYLLYATLCVLARGAATVEGGVSANSASDPAVATEARQSTETATTETFAASSVDAVYFDSLYDAEKLFLALQDEDRTFQRGKENALVRAILTANRACSLAAFDDAVRTYKAYATTGSCVVFELLVKQCRRSLFEHMERFA